MQLRIEYQGWSGCLVHNDLSTDVPTLAFDPSPDSSLDSNSKIVLITHGHPEHVGGVARHVSSRERQPIWVIGSRSVCNYLRRRSVHDGDRFVEAVPGSNLEVQGWKIAVFGWKHMGLWPDGIGNKLVYMKKLLSNPAAFAQIALNGLSGPAHAPMLGFRVTLSSGGTKPIIYFGEGVHRLTSLENLKCGLGQMQDATLVAAVEPEDETLLPLLFKDVPVSEIFVFEAHRIWRERFGLSQINRAELENRMRSSTSRFHVLSQGESVCL